jgi:hypothetical protein
MCSFSTSYCNNNNNNGGRIQDPSGNNSPSSWLNKNIDHQQSAAASEDRKVHQHSVSSKFHEVNVPSLSSAIANNNNNNKIGAISTITKRDANDSSNNTNSINRINIQHQQDESTTSSSANNNNGSTLSIQIHTRIDVLLDAAHLMSQHADYQRRGMN